MSARTGTTPVPRGDALAPPPSPRGRREPGAQPVRVELVALSGRPGPRLADARRRCILPHMAETKRRVVLGACVCLLAVVACSGETSGGPDGSGGTAQATGGTGASGGSGGTGGSGIGGTGTGGGTGALTVGDVCAETGAGYCERAEVCGVMTFDACYDTYYGTCVAIAGDASAPAAVDSAWLDTCSAAFAVQACDSVAAGEVPPECASA